MKFAKWMNANQLNVDTMVNLPRGSTAPIYLLRPRRTKI